MMPGDMPCNEACGRRWCRWNADGLCQDNCVCERADGERGEEDGDGE